MKINSYLMFNGNCDAAFKFYEHCLGGKIVMMLTHRDAPSAEHISAGWHDKIMHVCLDLGDHLLMGSDSPPGYFETPQGFYVQISVEEPAEAERVFHALAENGKGKCRLLKPFGLSALACWSINSAFRGWLTARRLLELPEGVSRHLLWHKTRINQPSRRFRLEGESA